MASAELLERGLNLLLLDVVILLILRATWQTLPWKLALNEVQKDMSDSLQIISA